MISLLTLMLLGPVDVAEAHPGHTRHRNRPRPVRVQRHRPIPPPAARQGHNLSYRANHWTYPHRQPSYIWKWTVGHYDLRGRWVPGSWSVSVRF